MQGAMGFLKYPFSYKFTKKFAREKVVKIGSDLTELWS